MVSSIDLTIFIPTFNREKTLSKCLSKIYCQNFNHNKVEILVIDNNSKDE